MLRTYLRSHSYIWFHIVIHSKLLDQLSVMGRAEPYLHLIFGE